MSHNRIILGLSKREQKKDRKENSRKKIIYLKKRARVFCNFFLDFSDNESKKKWKRKKKEGKKETKKY